MARSSRDPRSVGDGVHPAAWRKMVNEQRAYNAQQTANLANRAAHTRALTMKGRSSHDIVIAPFSWAAIAYGAGVVAFLAAAPALIYLEHVVGGPAPAPKAGDLAVISGCGAVILALCLCPVIVRALLGKPALFIRESRLIALSPWRRSFPLADIERVRLGPSGPFVDAPARIMIVQKGGEQAVIEMFLASRLGPQLAEAFREAGVACDPWIPDGTAPAHDSSTPAS